MSSLPRNSARSPGKSEGRDVADTLTREQRRKCMAAIRGKDTKPEMIVRSITHRLGYRYGLHAADLPGKPDMVFRLRRAVVFVHGCYWHMHTCKRGRSTPATNTKFWRTKREGNRRRDRAACAALRSAGWRVLKVWECECSPAKRPRLIERLARFLQDCEPSRPSRRRGVRPHA